MICPVANLLLWDTGHVELCPFGEVQTLQLNYAIVLGTVSDVDALVQSQPVDLAELVVDVSTEGADPVGAKGKSIRVAIICLTKYFFTAHESIPPE